MRKLVVLSIVGLVLFAWALPARAITNGTPDGNGHPNVGLTLAAWDVEEEPGVIKPFCSGTLISPTVYLTAAHCTAYLESVGLANDEIWVTFDSVYTESSPRIHGTWHTNPAFSQRQSDPGDLAVIILDQAGPGTLAQLPEAGLLDQMFKDRTLQDQAFVNVGYGTDEKTRGHGPGEFPEDDIRKVSTSSFNALNKAWLRLSMNKAKGDGGTCYGDSGGPQFLGSSNLMVSITVTGDTPCYATNVTYRLDTDSARGFLDDYVTLP